MLTIIKTIFSFLGPIIDKILGRNSEKAMELRAQRELEEMAAFRSGRIPPRFLLFYILTAIFALFALLFLVALIFPNWLNLPELAKIRDLLDMGAGLAPL